MYNRCPRGPKELIAERDDGFMKNATPTLLALAALMLCGAREAKSSVLLNLVNPPGQTNTPYSLNFIAAGTTTDISFAGYQAPFRLWAEDISLTSGAGNLLGATWIFAPFTPFDTVDAGQFNDGFGSGTNGLFFANGTGRVDQFEQLIGTVVGQTYTLDFLFSNYPGSVGSGNQPSELLVSESAVPEPSTFVLLAAALAVIGALSRNATDKRSNKV
jgi:hypothetical protein